MKLKSIIFAFSFLILTQLNAQNHIQTAETNLNYVMVDQDGVLTANGIGIGTRDPKALLDVSKFIPNGTLGTVLGRLPEGNSTGDGTYLGIKGHKTQGDDFNNIKSFSLIHNFYGRTNSSINFYRGGSFTGGFLTFCTNTDSEKMRITAGGNVGIGTTTPKAVLDVATFIPNGKLGTVFGRLPEGNNTSDGTYLGVKGHKTQGDDFKNIKSFSLVHNFYGQTNSSINFYRGGSVTGGFITFCTNKDNEQVRILANGSVGIGTATPDSKLTVNGTVHATDVKADIRDWPDFVFKNNYNLPSLTEVEKHIVANGHLKGIPSANEAEEKGILLGEMNKKLLQKVEELTLYTIQQEKKIGKQEEEISELRALVQTLLDASK